MVRKAESLVNNYSDEDRDTADFYAYVFRRFEVYGENFITEELERREAFKLTVGTRRWREKAVLLSFVKQMMIPEWSLYISPEAMTWNRLLSVDMIYAYITIAILFYCIAYSLPYIKQWREDSERRKRLLNHIKTK